MTRVAVDLDRLTELVEHMERFAAHLAELRDVTYAQLRAAHSVWSGDAAAAYTAAQASWSTNAADVHEALAVLRSIAVTGRGNYDAALAANRRMWSAR
jgi:WXG100 family type VII secretion target